MTVNFSFRASRLWPRLLFAAGWVVFWLAVTIGENLPLHALFVGPGMMAAALILLARKNAHGR